QRDIWKSADARPSRTPKIWARTAMSTVRMSACPNAWFASTIRSLSCAQSSASRSACIAVLSPAYFFSANWDMFHFFRIFAIDPSAYIALIAFWIFALSAVFFGLIAIPTGWGWIGLPTILKGLVLVLV